MFKLIRRIIYFIIIVVLLVISYFGYTGYNMYKETISNTSIEDRINKIREKESYTKLDDIPQIYKDAVIAIEDHRFNDHSGIDFISIIRAIYVDIQNKELDQGGSTITQQLAKNMYFNQDKKFSRKVAEIFVAVDLEKNYSKDDILELYINTIYFGQGCYGIGEASRGFFNKTPAELTDYEATYLAGLPKAPSIYSSSKHEDLAKQRHKTVLNSMVKYNKISQQRADEIYENK